jgi:hypothetical protein
MIMTKRLYFSYLDEMRDVIPYLWEADGRGKPAASVEVSSREDYDVLVRGSLGGSNRQRILNIVQGREAAAAIARLLQATESAECIVSDLGDDIHCVGATLFSGNYDDGIPMIYDLTNGSVDLDIDPAVLQLCELNRVEDNDHASVWEIYSEEDEQPDQDVLGMDPA